MIVHIIGGPHDGDRMQMPDGSVAVRLPADGYSLTPRPWGAWLELRGVVALPIEREFSPDGWRYVAHWRY